MPVANAMFSLTNTEFKNVTNQNGYCLLNHLPFTKKKQPLTQKVKVTVDTISKEFGPFRFKKGKSLTMRFDMQSFNIPSVNAKGKQIVNN